MNLKQWINTLVGVTGYQLVHRPSVSRDIARGKYRWLQEMDIRTVVDGGANVGQFAQTIRKILPEAVIYSFEPLESCFSELKANVSSLGPIHCFHCALGSESAVVAMHHNSFSPSSSILKAGKRHIEAFPHTAQYVEEQVTVYPLDQLAPELALNPKILFKIDVQGYELNVLRGAEKSLPLIDVIVVETSFIELYEGQPLFHEIYEFLARKGFRYVGSLDQVTDPKNGMMLQSDSVFLKTDAGKL